MESSLWTSQTYAMSIPLQNKWGEGEKGKKALASGFAKGITHPSIDNGGVIQDPI